MRMLDIIKFVTARGRTLVAQEIASALAILVSSLSYLLGTLVDRGYLTRSGRCYAAGPGLERLRTYASSFTLAEAMASALRVR